VARAPLSLVLSAADGRGAGTERGAGWFRSTLAIWTRRKKMADLAAAAARSVPEELSGHVEALRRELAFMETAGVAEYLEAACGAASAAGDAGDAEPASAAAATRVVLEHRVPLGADGLRELVSRLSEPGGAAARAVVAAHGRLPFGALGQLIESGVDVDEFDDALRSQLAWCGHLAHSDVRQVSPAPRGHAHVAGLGLRSPSAPRPAVADALALRPARQAAAAARPSRAPGGAPHGRRAPSGAPCARPRS
jgi:hypothetical protein